MQTLYDTLKEQKSIRILILRLKPVGDTVLISAVLRNLKRLFPQAEIDVVVYPFVVDLIKNNPYIDNVVVLDRTLKGRLLFYLKSLTRRYDVIIDYINNPTSTAIALLTRAKYRIGNATRRNAFYSHRITKKHAAYSAIRCLRALEPLGLSNFDDYQPELFIDDESQELADKYIMKECGDSRPVIGIFASSKYQKRQYSLEYSAQVGKMIAERYHVTVLYLFGKDDIESYNAIDKVAGNHERIILGSTDVPLSELSGQIKRLSFFISNDTGPKHIATAFNVPTLCIYKTTSKIIWNHPDQERFPGIVAEPDPEKAGSYIDPEPEYIVSVFREDSQESRYHCLISIRLLKKEIETHGIHFRYVWRCQLDRAHRVPCRDNVNRSSDTRWHRNNARILSRGTEYSLVGSGWFYYCHTDKRTHIYRGASSCL